MSGAHYKTDILGLKTRFQKQDPDTELEVLSWPSYKVEQIYVCCLSSHPTHLLFNIMGSMGKVGGRAGSRACHEEVTPYMLSSGKCYTTGIPLQ